MTILRTNSATGHIPVSLLAEIVEYNEHTGAFRWMERPAEHFLNRKRSPEAMASMWNSKYAGRPAFTCKDPRGYYKGVIGGTFVWAHRVAWALVSGKWPTQEIDHINRNKSDNRFRNLRHVSHQRNAMNRDQSLCGPRYE